MKKILHLVLVGGCSLSLFLAGGITCQASQLKSGQVEAVVGQTMASLFTGREPGRSLRQKQKDLISMAEAGAISKSAIRHAVESSVLPVLKHERTTRYILKELPARFDSIFAPFVKWDEARKIIWKEVASTIGDGKRMEFKIGSIAPEGTPWLNFPQKNLFPQMAGLTGGRIFMKVYGGGIMGEDTDILRKMDVGQLEGCGCTALGILAASPDMSVFLIPGLFRNYKEVDYVSEKIRKRIDRSCEKRGYILAALIDSGFFYMFSKNRIASIADMRTSKIGTWFGSIETALYEELGIKPTPVAAPEVVSSLSSGLIDTNVAPPAWVLGMQAYQYENYYIKQPLLYSPGAVIVSTHAREKWAKKFGISRTLAFNIQELLVHEVRALEPEWRANIRSYEAKSLKAFVKKCGMKAVTLSDSDMRLIEEAGIRVREELVGRAYPRDLLEKALAALKEYRGNGGNGGSRVE